MIRGSGTRTPHLRIAQKAWRSRLMSLDPGLFLDPGTFKGTSHLETRIRSNRQTVQIPDWHDKDHSQRPTTGDRDKRWNIPKDYSILTLTPGHVWGDQTPTGTVGPGSRYVPLNSNPWPINRPRKKSLRVTFSLHSYFYTHLCTQHIYKHKSHQQPPYTTLPHT